MYDIKQFRPTLFVVLLMGVTGFAMAISSAGLWMLATGLMLLAGWMLRSNFYAPLPRLVANGITVLCAVWSVMLIRMGTTEIIAFGQFMVMLQLVKLFELRGNRDYAQLLILSLLLMVAASITTTTLWFGLLLIAYLIVSLYCCLLFHLKVESDQAKAYFGIKDPLADPPSLKQDQRHLARSMRRYTAIVAVVAFVMAVAVFVLFPRGAGANFITPLTITPQTATTGFSDTVSFQQVARITQSNEEVAKVWVWEDNKQVTGSRVLLLRGVTLDVYGGNDATAGQWQWNRLPDRNGDPTQVNAEVPVALLPEIPQGVPRLRQQILLRPSGHNVLFSIGGVYEFRPSRGVRVRYSSRSQSLRLVDALDRPLEYNVQSTGIIAAPDGLNPPDLTDVYGPAGERVRTESNIDPAIDRYVRKADVSGSDGDGAFWERRDPATYVDPLDADIARAIEKHLQTQFNYTLDLTDARRIAGKDPLVAFLEDFKRGHCEYFAGAMTLLCQSLGLQARMVVGFKCDDYNTLGGFYTVRQSHAHAWVEVLQSDGIWHSYDPTSSSDEEYIMQTSFMTKVRQFMDYLNYKWADAVVTYDNDARTGLMMQVEQKLTNTAIQTTVATARWKEWLKLERWTLSSNVLASVIGLAVLALFGAVLWFIIERLRLRRRAARIGLDALPAADQLRLVRQLGFYDDLIRLLERHKIERPDYMTHHEFSQSLAYLPTEAYDIIRRLTRIFYGIRFGNRQLHASHRRRLDAMIDRVGDALDKRQAPVA